ncbi:MAG: electron transport complex subunit E [Clostridia bacterium]|nr:electron transport complex subunit E [Clostridia bacterium]
MKIKDIIMDGLFRQNPTLRLVLGVCSTLALTTSAFDSFGMGVAVTFVLVCSNVIVSLLRNVIPDKVRIPAFVLVIATFVTIVQLFLRKYVNALYANFGVFLPLIVVNCIILGRAEGFAFKNKVGLAALDGLFMGLGYTWAMVLIGGVREILGFGTIFGIKLWDFSIGFFASQSGAFFTYGVVIATFVTIWNAIERKQKLKSATAGVKDPATIAEEKEEN